MSVQKDTPAQTFIGEGGEILSQPLTWDGEPMYCPETVREGLFDPSWFGQMRGQLALEVDDEAR